MRELCHRCHGELPELAGGAGRGDEDTLLFCPRCCAPQILLPEHMRIETPAGDLAPTTGALPPPRPAGAATATATGATALGEVDWQAALSSIAVVATVGAILTGIGNESAPFFLICVLWIISAAVIALGLYARRRPAAWMDARTGMRVGVATGLMMVAAMAMALSATGVVRRFGIHTMSARDAESAQELAVAEAQASEWMQMQNQTKEIQQKFHGFINSPEARAGSQLFRLGILGGIILLLSAGGGAFAGRLRASQAPRTGLRRDG